MAVEKKRFHHSKKEYSGMIKEDMSAPCMLPREVIDKYWPKAAGSMGERVGDLFSSAQKQMHEDLADLKRESKAGKY